MIGTWFSRSAKRQPGPRGRKPATELQLEHLEDRCLLSIGFRSYDGTGNNLLHPDWGVAGAQLLRVAPAEYGNGISTPAGANRPSARVISNALAAESEEVLNDRDLSDFIYVFGQFLDHDLDLTVNAAPAQAFNIPVPKGDPFFDPAGTGTQVIRLNRSAHDPDTGTGRRNPRQQINEITAFLDGSVIYGSDATRARALRTLAGGRMKLDADGLLPLNTAGLPNDNNARHVPDNELFLAGDVRANENIELTAMHTLFVREHNRIASRIVQSHPGLGDEQIYQRARAVVVAELQVIAYKEWLPALLGRELPAYRGYNPSVNPGIANEFSTAGFRLGHSLLGDDVEFLDNDGEEIRPEVALSDAFFNPTIVRETGIDPILKYLATDNARELDNVIVNSVRNFLFGQPGQGGFDLASLNIQRGRDHGLADYNRVRVAYGLPAVTRFDDLTSDRTKQQILRALYGNVNNIDLWVGGLAEDHVRGASVGPTFYRLVVDQFTRIRDGDRFWYQRVFVGSQLRELEGTKLSDVLRRNTTLTNLQENVIFFDVQIRGQVFFDANRDGERNRFEPGLQGVRLELLDEAGAVIATARTDRDGNYVFDDVHEPGAFRVRVVVPDGLEVIGEAEEEVRVTRGQVIGGVNFGLARRR